MSDLPELQIKYRNLSLSAKGALGIIAAIIIAVGFFVFLAAYWFRLTHG
ncbi:hypothetical protein SAMN05216330_111103 [Bradyrhizobium sp. Ghvi]|nr:hypothetical protein [Bradyrhizobium sp. Ghvi]SFP87445.1 hypothetical protein SAMN05216330_111103 [Bradyrhizobium sp. Ghvi]